MTLEHSWMIEPEPDFTNEADPVRIAVGRTCKNPRVLIGEQSDGSSTMPTLQELGWGRMSTTSRRFRPYPGEPWGFDNGAFVAWLHGRPFPVDEFLRRIDIFSEISKKTAPPWIAVLPDIVGGGLKSLEFSLGWLEDDELPQEWPWWLAVQDGMSPSDLDDILDRVDGLFLGGTNAFKGTAFLWAMVSHGHGKKFHYARASTPRKIAHAKAVGADSIDSAFPLWTKDRFREFQQAVLFGPPKGQLCFLSAADMLTSAEASLIACGGKP